MLFICKRSLDGFSIEETGQTMVARKVLSDIGINTKKITVVAFNHKKLLGFMFGRVLGINKSLGYSRLIDVVRHEAGHYKLKHYRSAWFFRLMKLFAEKTLQQKEKEADEYFALHNH